MKVSQAVRLKQFAFCSCLLRGPVIVNKITSLPLFAGSPGGTVLHAQGLERHQRRREGTARGAACVTHCQERAQDPACASISIPVMGWGKRSLTLGFFFKL